MNKTTTEDINKMLRRASERYQDKHGGEMPAGAYVEGGVETRTPLDELMSKETEMDLEGEEAVRIWLEAVAWLLDFVTREGPHPGYVMLNLYVILKKYRPSAIWDIGYRQTGLLFDVSGAAIEWRVSQLDAFARSQGLKGVKVGWQRSASGCANYSDVQKGNCNRLGGKRANKKKKS